MSQTQTLTLSARPEDLLALTPLFREGVRISVSPGRTLRQTMVQDLGFCPECVEERVQTVFLDGSPVDDIDADQVTQDCTLALAGALPGVAGIAMRRGSPVGVFREGISHGTGHGEGHGVKQGAGGMLCATLKLFNSVALECLAWVLEQGVELRAGRLADLLSEEPEALAGAGFRLDGRVMGRQEAIAALRGLPGPVRLTAEIAA